MFFLSVLTTEMLRETLVFITGYSFFLILLNSLAVVLENLFEIKLRAKVIPRTLFNVSWACAKGKGGAGC